MTLNAILTARDGLDLSSCDREPIHVPGSVQPHGTLIAVGRSDHVILQAAANVHRAFGQAAEQLVGRPLAAALPEFAATIADRLSDLPLDQSLRHLGRWRSSAVDYDVLAHLGGDDLAIIELEEAGEDPPKFEAVFPLLRRFVDRLQHAATIDELCALAVQDVRVLTGFDRVLLYCFDDEWNGTVVAEDRNEALPRYLGLRFPASDIPGQARELYRRNRLRLIPDADYAPTPIVPPANPRTGRLLDLSLAALRSVSPVHVEYMRNMGTAASMSISILQDDRLWGLISCHNKTPRRVALHVRNACDFVAHIFSLQLAGRQRADDAERRVALAAIRTNLLAYMAQEDHFLDGLAKHPEELCALANAEGAALLTTERCELIGKTPTEPQVRSLALWLRESGRPEVFATSDLGALLPAARAYEDAASGLLAISISRIHSGFVFWFRPGLTQTVRWGGDPTKPVEEGQGGSLRLHPRRSFDIWQEVVKGRAEPWRAGEVEAATQLRGALVDIVLRRAEEMASLAEELQRANKELEAFSYSVSHDLRAPFRHIVGYAELLKQYEGDRLEERGRRYLDTIIESAFAAGKLVDSLLSFSQMGRRSLRPCGVDLNKMARGLRDLHNEAAPGRQIVWTIDPLPTVWADPLMIRLAVENLIANAVKYTSGRERAQIHIGAYDENGHTICFVEDNGVGFDMTYVGKLFGVFQRLHRMEEFEGTGIGLANVKRIIERHGGRVWAKGEPNKGATFFFTLPAPPGSERSWPN